METLYFLQDLSTLVLHAFSEFTRFAERRFADIPSVSVFVSFVDNYNFTFNPFYRKILDLFKVSSFGEMTMLRLLLGCVVGLTIFRVLKWVLDIIL